MHETVSNEVSKSHFKGKETKEDTIVTSGLYTWMHKKAYFIHMCTHAQLPTHTDKNLKCHTKSSFKNWYFYKLCNFKGSKRKAILKSLMKVKEHFQHP